MARSIVMPSFGMYTVEGTVVRWLKPTGAMVEAGEAVLELETDKALADVTSPETGILHQVVEPGEQVKVESVLGYVLAPGEVAPSPAQPSPPAKAPAVEHEGAAPLLPTRSNVPASPNARRVARELGVDLTGLTGSGPGGRITEEDVRAAAAEAAQ